MQGCVGRLGTRDVRGRAHGVCLEQNKNFFFFSFSGVKTKRYAKVSENEHIYSV